MLRELSAGGLSVFKVDGIERVTLKPNSPIALVLPPYQA